MRRRFTSFIEAPRASMKDDRALGGVEICYRSVSKARPNVRSSSACCIDERGDGMDSAALDMQAPATRRDRVKRASDLVLSAVFCVVLPIAFWLAMVALVAWAVTGAFLSWQILTLTGGAMALILVPIWASLFASKRR
jgi:hypothetical protein